MKNLNIPLIDESALNINQNACLQTNHFQQFSEPIKHVINQVKMPNVHQLQFLQFEYFSVFFKKKYLVYINQFIFKK